jgi:formate dehydrogenase major subunit
MECVVVQDLFLNETAKYAHVFLPGSSFLEKDGTFTNAERRISRVRKVMAPLAGYADWEVTQLLANALGYPMDYTTRARSWTRSRALTPSFAGVSYAKIDRLGSVQWPCNDGTPRARDHARRRLCARQGQVHHHRSTWRPTRRSPARASRCC